MHEGQSHPDAARPSAPDPWEEGTRVVIVGAGFAGLEAAKQLGRLCIPVTLIDRNNHHLFQPLLYQAATAALSVTDIAEPVRRMVRRYRSVEVVYGDAVSIDRARRHVVLADGRQIGWTHLIVATGSRTSYFGHDEWRRFAPGLKTAEDARLIRSRLLLAFERAEQAQDPEERRRLTTFVVIGGGPTGVEMAGSIAELARHTLVRDFRHISPRHARVILAEGAERLLGSFDRSLSDYVAQRLAGLGVDVRTGTMVSEIGPGLVRLGDEEIGCGMTLWAAGVGSSPLGADLSDERDRAGRVPVDDRLRLPSDPNVYVLGDLALAKDGNGNALPGLAQVAKQQGYHVGRHLARQIKQGRQMPPFTYRSRGNTAIVGRHSAVYEYGGWRLRGWLAWALWAIVHVYLLAGSQNRTVVTLRWLWRYLTYERGSRLISPWHEAPAEAEPGHREPGRRAAGNIPEHATD